MLFIRFIVQHHISNTTLQTSYVKDHISHATHQAPNTAIDTALEIVGQIRIQAQYHKLHTPSSTLQTLHVKHHKLNTTRHTLHIKHHTLSTVASWYPFKQDFLKLQKWKEPYHCYFPYEELFSKT